MTNQKIMVLGVDLNLAEVNQLLRQGKKIEAIRLVCNTTKMGLKDAKEFVENLQAGDYEKVAELIKKQDRPQGFIQPKLQPLEKEPLNLKPIIFVAIVIASALAVFYLFRF